MIIDLDELDRCLNYIKHVNNVDLEDIVWKRGDKKIETTLQQCCDFKFIGLNNAYFPWVFDIENSNPDSNLWVLFMSWKIINLKGKTVASDSDNQEPPITQNQIINLLEIQKY